MFLDHATIEVSGGQGGRGCVSWRREKYIPHGGPDGGNGGRGGSVYLIANENTDTLGNFLSRKRFSAQNGDYGSGQNKAGKSGEDLYLDVPPGTVVTCNDVIIADLQHTGEQVCVAQGGRGGFGNAHFKSSTRQRPDFAELGEPGETKSLHLELKLVADVGIIGYPSVGKSTLISVISGARPKIAAYEFTTLVPNLGVATVRDRSFIVCDVPGLIEGASEGKGLGHQFLRHIERCGVVLHLLDIQRAMIDGVVDPEKLVEDYRTIRKELEAYSPALAQKRELIVLSKIDLAPDSIEDIIKVLTKKKITVVHSFSAATTAGIDDLLLLLLPIVLEEREKRAAAEPEEALPVLRPHEEKEVMGAYRIETREDGALVVRGTRIEQFTKMTNFASQGAVKRFRDVIERTGLKNALRRASTSEDAPIYIGDIRVDEHL